MVARIVKNPGDRALEVGLQSNELVDCTEEEVDHVAGTELAVAGDIRE